MWLSMEIQTQDTLQVFECKTCFDEQLQDWKGYKAIFGDSTLVSLKSIQPGLVGYMGEIYTLLLEGKKLAMMAGGKLFEKSQQVVGFSSGGDD
jgi:hypothetical protein